MSRNLVICCDGTNNQFGIENTSVVRLVQVLERDADQMLYYDPGVGTLPEPGVWSWLGKKLSQAWDLAFGSGVAGKVEGAYAHLMDFWEPGDRVFLFGFSRGAYTVRVLAGLLHSLGLLSRGNRNLVPYVLRLFGALRKEGSDEGKSRYWKLCELFRWTFARPVSPEDTSRRFPVHFLGVWDTVSSVGWVLDPVKYPFTEHNPSIGAIRHAVAVDERRWFFRQNLMQQTGGQDFLELWFPGVHADVGGGYPEAEGGLWREPFSWMLTEAEKFGLRVDPGRLKRVWTVTPPPERPWDEPMHDSMTLGWKLAEFVPKKRGRPGSSKTTLQIGRRRPRYIPPGALLHWSTLLRIRETAYSPPNMTAAFLSRVRALKQVPPVLAYEP